MNVAVLYLLLLKAVLMSFSGLAGLPIVQRDFVTERKIVTGAQLNTAVAVTRTIPGPNGLYVVCVGYFAAGVPGAIAGTLALMTPAFLIVVLLRWVGAHAGHPRVRSVISAVLIAGAALLAVTTLQLARSAVIDGFSAAVAAGSLLAMALTPVDTLWVMLAAAAIGLVRHFAR